MKSRSLMRNRWLYGSPSKQSNKMINPVRWLQLSADVRLKLKEILGLSKSGGVVVDNSAGGISTVLSDGHTPKDLYDGITLKKLQDYFNSKEKDGLKLFEQLVTEVENKIKGVVEAPKVEIANGKKSKATKTGA